MLQSIFQQRSRFPVRQDSIRLALQGCKIFFLKLVARFRRRQEFGGARQRACSRLRSDRLVCIKHLVYLDDKFGDGAQPGELLVANQKLQEFPAIDLPVHALVSGALAFQQNFVQVKQSSA